MPSSYKEWACSLGERLLGMLGVLGSLIDVKQDQDYHRNNYKMSQREMRLGPIVI